VKDINLDMLFETYTSESAAKEATAFKTIPTGSYNLQGDTVTVGEGDDERIVSLYGRLYAHLAGTLTTKTGDRRGKQFFDVSWVEYRVNPGTMKGELITDENRAEAQAGGWPQDKAFKLWNQLAVAFDAVKKPVREVLEMFKMYKLNLFITESFNTDKGWRSPRTAEEMATYVAAGYDRKNFVQSISRLK